MINISYSLWLLDSQCRVVLNLADPHVTVIMRKTKNHFLGMRLQEKKENMLVQIANSFFSFFLEMLHHYQKQIELQSSLRMHHIVA